jgi:tetratricopeptide (TPR) repeat protein
MAAHSATSGRAGALAPDVPVDPVIDVTSRSESIDQPRSGIAARVEASTRRWRRAVGARRVRWALAAAALAVVAHLNTLNNPFVFDDLTEVVENPSIGDPRDIRTIVSGNRTRPLTNLSYALDFARGGLDPFPYHATNLALHALNVLLVFAITRRLFRQLSNDADTDEADRATPAAFTAAAMFAVHPLLTSTVGYVSARAELLAATWFLASFAALHRSAGERWRRLPPLGLGSFVLALAAKETAVMLPAVLLAADALQSRRDAGWRRRLLQWHLPLAAAVLLLAAARVAWYLTREQPDTAGWQWQNFALNAHILERYLALLLLPVSLSIVPPVAPLGSVFDLRVLRGLAAIVLIACVAALGARRNRLTALGLVWFLLLLVPSAMIVVLAPVGQPMAEHRVYLASCGLFMAVSAIACQSDVVRRRPLVAIAALAMVLAAFTTLTILRNRVWSDPVLLWEDAARKAPTTWMAQFGAAEAHRARGDCESAVEPYRRAVSLRPAESAAQLGLADCMQRLGLPEEALRWCREALQVSPRSGEAAACVQRLSR